MKVLGRLWNLNWYGFVVTERLSWFLNGGILFFFNRTVTCLQLKNDEWDSGIFEISYI